MIGEKETQNEMKTNKKKTRNINGLAIPEGAFQVHRGIHFRQVFERPGLEIDLRTEFERG